MMKFVLLNVYNLYGGMSCYENKNKIFDNFNVIDYFFTN